MYSLNIISCASGGEFFFCIPQSCASEFTLHIIAEGHLLGMVVTMKDYTAIIVDIKSSFFQKKKKLLSSRPPQLSMFNSKKRKKHFW